MSLIQNCEPVEVAVLGSGNVRIWFVSYSIEPVWCDDDNIIFILVAFIPKCSYTRGREKDVKEKTGSRSVRLLASTTSMPS